MKMPIKQMNNCSPVATTSYNVVSIINLCGGLLSACSLGSSQLIVNIAEPHSFRVWLTIQSYPSNQSRSEVADMT